MQLNSISNKAELPVISCSCSEKEKPCFVATLATELISMIYTPPKLPPCKEPKFAPIVIPAERAEIIANEFMARRLKEALVAAKALEDSKAPKLG